MIFPKKARNQAPAAAWWQAPQPQKASKGNVILIALLAGSVGGVLGVNASGGDIFHRVQLVSSTSTIERAPDSVAGIAQRVLPSVVSISTRTFNGGGTGSGFIIDSSGYILTNNHVISEAAQTGGSIQVSLNDGSNYSAKVIGRDASYDLAVLKITASGLKALQFGDSDAIAVGDSVIAIGSPLGLTGTVTTGIISAKNRAVTAGESNSESSFINALQTDAAINPGNSGGALINARGQIIGVNSAIATLSSGGTSGSIGLGFAIPITEAKRVIDEIITSPTNTSTRPLLGVFFDNTYEGIGARILRLSPGEAADVAGIPVGSIIKSIGGQRVTDQVSAVVRIRSFAPGATVSVTVELPNSGGVKTFTVKLGKAPSNG